MHHKDIKSVVASVDLIWRVSVGVGPAVGSSSEVSWDGYIVYGSIILNDTSCSVISSAGFPDGHLLARQT